MKIAGKYMNTISFSSDLNGRHTEEDNANLSVEFLIIQVTSCYRAKTTDFTQGNNTCIYGADKNMSQQPSKR